MTSDAELLSLRPFCPACIISTRGYDFREGQGVSSGWPLHGIAISNLEPSQAKLPPSPPAAKPGGCLRAKSRRFNAAHGRMRMARLTVNGQPHNIDVDPNTPLLWVLREQVGLTGTKYGCGIAQCGACTVHIDGAAVRSCSLPVSEGAGKRLTSPRGLAREGALSQGQKAWLEHDVPQC